MHPTRDLEKVVVEFTNLPDISHEDLLRFRTEMRLRQDEMAEMFGMSPDSYGHLERNKRNNPCIPRAKSLLLHLINYYLVQSSENNKCLKILTPSKNGSQTTSKVEESIK